MDLDFFVLGRNSDDRLAFRTRSFFPCEFLADLESLTAFETNDDNRHITQTCRYLNGENRYAALNDNVQDTPNGSVDTNGDIFLSPDMKNSKWDARPSPRRS